MYSKIDICNRALRLIRQSSISSMQDKSKEAEECNFLYPIVKREVIESYPWHSTRKKIILRSIYNNDDFNEDFKYRFLLPFDCIRVLLVDENNFFKRNGLYLYANKNKIKLLYMSEISEDLMTFRLIKLISIKLAIELERSLLGESSYHFNLQEVFDKEIKIAKQIDSQEGDIQNYDIQFNNASDWISARY